MLILIIIRMLMKLLLKELIFQDQVRLNNFLLEIIMKVIMKATLIQICLKLWNIKIMIIIINWVLLVEINKIFFVFYYEFIL